MAWNGGRADSPGERVRNTLLILRFTSVAIVLNMALLLRQALRSS
jgi:hypothetical protein